METSAFDFDLPDALIAQHAVEPRDRSRLMVVRRDSGTIAHHTFADLPDLLAPGDVLVRNNTRVVPARIVGHRVSTGGRWEGLFLRDRPDGSWEILAKTRGRPAPGETVVVGHGLPLTLEARLGEGRWAARPGRGAEGPSRTLLEAHGTVPLPPYIRKGIESEGDRARYQTVYAAVPGSVAAPTAGLHFTDDVFRRLDARGIERLDLTLHVGIGTFRPIEAERIEDHALHAEAAELSPDTAEALNRKRADGGRVVAVGTTSARVLETSAASGRFEPFAGDTALYLRPGHAFRGVDALVTNFHLPRSSLLVLVSALAGVDLIREAYAEAVRLEYRFYSYGDAMLIV
ncbi:tRNA preQ1(34) S-adenosylmethionine ribosyltransferase-isomerase QueA [Tundrisphaera sp. TA3]|uniref:tRNA preQ1(34) S-adenosylmethionine ribosyltransferase-isomerase QueA n=1 Tax=Tundrisphaera sp. TA3 TaxID=3435775 RepID=UPI003EC13600